MFVSKKEHDDLKRKVATLEGTIQRMADQMFNMDMELQELKKKDKETAYLG